MSEGRPDGGLPASGAGRAGFVTLLGRPNVGKSTLLNRLVGAKIAIVTPKPQTTRHRIAGIVTEERGQIVFLDTPGIHRPRTALNEWMMRAAERAAREADVVVHVVDDRSRAEGEEERLAREMLAGLATPRLLVLNKADRLPEAQAKERLGELLAGGPYAEGFAVSALTGEGVDRLLDALFRLLPPGSPFYPEDDLSDLPMRFIAAEVIREKLFLALSDELPYSVGVAVEEYREDPASNLVRIRADVVVERPSQKAIVIGRGGRVLKEVGTAARRELEAQTGQRVYLELFVKVEKDWTRDERILRRLGYA